MSVLLKSYQELVSSIWLLEGRTILQCKHSQQKHI